MNYIVTDVLRTTSTVSDSDFLAPVLGSDDSEIPGFRIFDNCGSQFYRASVQPALFQEVDNFWGEAYGTRTSSVLTPEILTALEASSIPVENKFRVTRTVSDQARENSVDDLTLDEFAVETPPCEEITSSSRSASAASDETTASDMPAPKRNRTIKVSARKSLPAAIPHVATDDLPRLHLGEGGRSKLKSLISSAIKDNEELRQRISGICKVKLASIPQLLQMAHLCGLWDEAVSISQNFVNRR